MSEPLAAPPLDSMMACRVLAEHGVRYVLIGGVALNLAGVTMVTVDLDICYEATQANTRALLRALRALEATPVDADNRALPAAVDARALQLHDTFLFVTRAGRFDCLRVPSGTAGYDDLIRTAVELDVDGVSTWIPSVEDMVRMKRAAGRPKDRLALEHLGTLREILDRESPISFNPSDLPEANPP